MTDAERSDAGWNAAHAARFFDEYGAREWSRFDDGRTPSASLDVHIRMLERFVRPGDLVATAAAGLPPDDADLDPELRAFVRRTDLSLAEDPGIVGCGLHTLAVVEIACSPSTSAFAARTSHARLVPNPLEPRNPPKVDCPHRGESRV